MRCTHSSLKRNELRRLRPPFYNVELNITELCNMKCDFCPRSMGYPNSNLNMSLKTVDIIVEHLKELKNPYIYISGRGEPTLHPQFDIILDKLSEFKVGLATNGNRVDKYLNKINKLSKVDYSIYDESKLSPSEAFKKYKNFHIMDKRTIVKNAYHNRAGSVNKPITKNNPLHPILGLFCEKPFIAIYINYNGDYNLCCNEWFNPTVLENVYTQSIKNFINKNKKLQEFKNDLADGKRSNHPCSSCNKSVHPQFEKILLKKYVQTS